MLTTSAYQDISEGAADCAFRLPVNSQNDNVVRVALGTSLPAADTTDYDLYIGPNNGGDAMHVSFTALAPTDRVYARSDKVSYKLVVYRK